MCNSLLELLKKFQMSRSQLSSTIQRAEQTISDQASYMGKDNLQRCMTRVSPNPISSHLHHYPTCFMLIG